MGGDVTTILAIDPGDETSAAVLFDAVAWRPLAFYELSNAAMRCVVQESRADALAIEYTPPYAMSTAAGHNYVPRQVVDTAIEVGRFIECRRPGTGYALVSRLDVKKHLLGRSVGNDTAVAAAVLDRYGGTPQRAKGTKKAPGPLYGIKGSHLYAALAVAITYAETTREQLGGP